MKHLRAAVLLVMVLSACGGNPPVPPTPAPLPPVAATSTAIPATVAAPATSASVPATPTAPARATATLVPAATVIVATPTAVATLAPPADLRKLDLKQFLQRDTAMRSRLLVTVTKETNLNLGTQVAFNAQGAGESFGFIDFKNGVQFGDIDGDRRDEALLTVNSGGTAGPLLLILLAPAPGGARFVEAFPGYKIGGKFEKGELVVIEPEYAGWEPNCCPSGLNTRRFALRDGALQKTLDRSEGAESAKSEVVQRFYEALAAKRFDDAYAYLSDEFASANPFTSWERGYSRTVGIDLVSARPQPDGGIRARLVAADKDAAGKVSERRYDVVWSMIYLPPAATENKRRFTGWLLHRARVELNEPLPTGETGTVSGKLQYPSEQIPPLTIFVRNIATSATYTLATRVNQTTYSLAVPPGRYVAIAYVQGSVDFGGYTEFVRCGLQASCPSHALIAFDVAAGRIANDVDISDWYAPPEGALAKGTVTGKLQYPSEQIPPLVIYARNIASEVTYSLTTRANQTTYSLGVPPGRYIAFAHLQGGSGEGGGYTEFVRCGLQASCPSHAFIAFDVAAGRTTDNIDISDWYAPPGAMPPKPR